MCPSLGLFLCYLCRTRRELCDVSGYTQLLCPFFGLSLDMQTAATSGQFFRQTHPLKQAEVKSCRVQHKMCKLHARLYFRPSKTNNPGKSMKTKGHLQSGSAPFRVGGPPYFIPEAQPFDRNISTSPRPLANLPVHYNFGALRPPCWTHFMAQPFKAVFGARCLEDASHRRSCLRQTCWFSRACVCGVQCVCVYIYIHTIQYI